MRTFVIALFSLLVGVAGVSTWQAISANKKVGQLEVALETVAVQYGQARAQYAQLDTLTADRQEAQRHEHDRLQAQLAALRNAPADECTDRRVPGAIDQLLRTPAPD